MLLDVIVSYANDESSTMLIGLALRLSHRFHFRGRIGQEEIGVYIGVPLPHSPDCCPIARLFLPMATGGIREAIVFGR